MAALLEARAGGLYCPAGDFWIDPQRPVGRAVVTHAHADHARPGSDAYLTASPGVEVLRQRVQADARIEGAAYGESRQLGRATVSLHPAGHLLGSAQVRVEVGGEVWVASGDYKTAPDPTCEPFEAVPCHTFITESTFGLPIYRWPTEARLIAELRAWWLQCRDEGRTAVLFCYALGKAQRALAGLMEGAPGPIAVHGAVRRFVDVYRAAGVAQPEVLDGSVENAAVVRGQGLVVAPPSTAGSTWLAKYAPMQTAMASGWMRVRGNRRRRALDRGFVMSDHADWPGLLQAISATGAEQVLVTHGSKDALVRWLEENGRRAAPLVTRYGDRAAEDSAEVKA